MYGICRSKYLIIFSWYSFGLTFTQNIFGILNNSHLKTDYRFSEQKSVHCCRSNGLVCFMSSHCVVHWNIKCYIVSFFIKSHYVEIWFLCALAPFKGLWMQQHCYKNTHGAIPLPLTGMYIRLQAKVVKRLWRLCKKPKNHVDWKCTVILLDSAQMWLYWCEMLQPVACKLFARVACVSHYVYSAFAIMSIGHG